MEKVKWKHSMVNIKAIFNKVKLMDLVNLYGMMVGFMRVIF